MTVAGSGASVADLGAKLEEIDRLGKAGPVLLLCDRKFDKFSMLFLEVMAKMMSRVGCSHR